MHDGAIFLSGVGLLLAMIIQIYPRFDKIVVLSPNCKMGMIRKIPSLSDKIVVIFEFNRWRENYKVIRRGLFY